VDILPLLLLILGFGLLIVGAEILVRGAVQLATAIGISPLIIGLTVVAFGTSSPELAVSIQSAWMGQADLALGNVVGSNIFNVLFILGLAALVAPLLVSRQLIVRDVPLMIAASLLLPILGWDGSVSRLDGLILFAISIAYLAYSIRQSRKANQAIPDEVKADLAERQRPWYVNALLVIVGLLVLVIGSDWLVDGAVAIARSWGVSELVIGLTIVAAGTSMPEVAASIIASLRAQRDIAVGNVVGSNLFNILVVLGLAAVFAPNGVEVPMAAFSFDIPVMIAVAVACLPIFFSGRIIARWEGALFLGYYIAYTLYVILSATQHDALPLFSQTMLWFVIPLTLVTFIILAVREANP
jgi:cation:H+ antiporter